MNTSWEQGIPCLLDPPPPAPALPPGRCPPAQRIQEPASRSAVPSPLQNKGCALLIRVPRVPVPSSSAQRGRRSRDPSSQSPIFLLGQDSGRLLVEGYSERTLPLVSQAPPGLPTRRLCPPGLALL